MFYAVAIDGPAGAGKSTIARRAAKELQFLYVDTGALYRAIGYCLLKNGVDIHNAEAVEAFLPQIAVSLRYIGGEQHVFLGEEDVNAFLRTPEVSMAASTVSALPAVRQFLLQEQLQIAAKNHVIMDGRDIGTVILPHAQVKIFLTASAEERARRRMLELQAKGENSSFAQVLQDIWQRDEQDIHRAISPLKKADDAVILDTSDLDLEASVAALIKIVKEKLSHNS